MERKGCDSEVLDILEDVRDFLNLFFDYDRQSKKRLSELMGSQMMEWADGIRERIRPLGKTASKSCCCRDRS